MIINNVSNNPRGNNYESITSNLQTTEQATTATPQASTKVQGSTCNHAAQMNNRACYVGSNRGCQSVKVFTPDFEHLYDSVKRNSEHLTGHDLLAARQEYMNIASPKMNIENIPKNEEILQEKESQELTLSF